MIIGNHYVVDVPPYCELRPNPGSDRCWVWTAQDFSEDKMIVEKLALKFATAAGAQSFQKAFENAKLLNKKAIDLTNAEKEDANRPPAERAEGGNAPATNAEVQSGLEEPSQSQPPAAANPFAGLSLFGMASNGSSSFSVASSGGGFGSAPAGSSNSFSLASTGSSLFGSASSGSGASSLFSFAASNLPRSDLPASTGSSLFGSAASSFASVSSGGSFFNSAPSSGGSLFSSAVPTGNSFFGSVASSGTGFGGSTSSGSTLFGTPSLRKSTSSDVQSPVKEEPNLKADEEDDSLLANEELTTVPGYRASMTLNVLKELKTGEEDEEELYSQRSKLFRFRDGEWKERGLGEAKLLKHKVSGKVRFVLRHEKLQIAGKRDAAREAEQSRKVQKLDSVSAT